MEMLIKQIYIGSPIELDGSLSLSLSSLFSYIFCIWPIEVMKIDEIKLNVKSKIERKRKGEERKEK